MKDIPDISGFYNYTISNFNISQWNEVLVQTHSAESFDPEERGYLDLQAESIEINAALFSGLNTNANTPRTFAIQENNNFVLSCSCQFVGTKLCNHQTQVLYNVLQRTELRIFFDDLLRKDKLKRFAEPYGLQNENNLDDYFQLEYLNRKTAIKPASSSLFSIESTFKLQEQFLTNKNPGRYIKPSDIYEMFVVFKQHKYYRHLNIELIEASTTQTGKPKNPVNLVNALEKIWNTDSLSESKFFSGITLFQNNTTHDQSASAFEGLKSILKNPLGLKFYQHQSELSKNSTASSLTPLRIGNTIHELSISVLKADAFYEVSGEVILNETKYRLENLSFKYDFFLEINDSIHLVGNLKLLKVVQFLKEHQNKLLIHQSKYEEFRESILTKLENNIEVNYSYLLPATPKQITENKLDQPPQKFIYLTDSEPYVDIDPVMKYGDIEISILSKKQIYPQGIKGGFSVQRDKELEIQFAALLLKQHPFFKEQLEDDLPFFYLHKKHFLSEEWFINAFEEWQNQGITILGFNKLKGNKLDPNKVKITIKVISGIDWFNAEIDIRYGKKKASLPQINKAIRNKSKYIKLGDGSLGILPEEWIEKFSAYFNAGEIMDDTLKISKSNFRVITELFDEEAIDNPLKTELVFLHEKLQDFNSIKEIEVPAALNATLRDYQKQGLNWLNFLDDFNLGGCLADDMGLGKSIQILAFILLQRSKSTNNTNLLIVPTSLIFNWQAEIQKFAPSIKIYTLYGANRSTEIKDFKDYELIITSYGTLLWDIRFLKNYPFNYIFLDESQNIKNPESQRYKAACLLKSRNKIVITGTPIENNTFDLYGQLSFACPGLLGSKQYFRDIYSSPIDKFKDSKRATELQNKIKPFILRRTKKQVASELPDKTEMVLYCEMGTEQRKIYAAHEKEFREYICSKTNDEIPKSSIHVLRGLTRLRQICNSPLLLNDKEISEKASCKIDALLEQILSKSANHKILIFSQFVSMLDLVKKELEVRDINFSYLSGSTKNRDLVVKEFQDETSKRVFLISLKAGGTGLNLTQADYVYLIDPWWNPAVENQAIDRIYRIGQKKNVVAVRLICPETIEEKIINLQESKKDLFNDLINTDISIAKSLTKEGLLELLGNN